MSGGQRNRPKPREGSRELVGPRPARREVERQASRTPGEPSDQAEQPPPCPVTAAPGVGTTAKDLVDWIRARPGLVAGDPVPVTIGGLAGLRIDIAIVAGWKPSC